MKMELSLLSRREMKRPIWFFSTITQHGVQTSNEASVQALESRKEARDMLYRWAGGVFGRHEFLGLFVQWKHRLSKSGDWRSRIGTR